MTANIQSNDIQFNDIQFNDIQFGKLKEECGVFGIFNNDKLYVARLTYHGLNALQHRAQ
jgi:amidophosphoribosyltransferase